MGIFSRKPNVGKLAATGNVKGLLKALRNKDDDRRAKVVVALGQIGDRAAVPALIEVLKNDIWNVREKAASSLGKIGDKAAIPALVEALKSQGQDLWTRAAEALGKIGKAAVPALIEVLKNDHENIGDRAASALGKIGPDAKAAVPALTEALKAKDTRLRVSVATTLGKIGPDAEAAIPALTEAMEDQIQRVRRSAFSALGKIGVEVPDPEVQVLAKKRANVQELVRTGNIDGLIEALDDKYIDLQASKAIYRIIKENTKAGDVGTIRHIFSKGYKIGGLLDTVIASLGKLKDKWAVEPLIEILHRPYHGSSLEQAVEALGEIRDERAIKPLIEVFRRENREVWGRKSSLRIEVLRFLAESKRGPVEPTLNPLGDGDYEEVWGTRSSLHEEVMKALAKFKGAAVEPLIDALVFDYENVRIWAVITLDRIKDERATEALTKALKDRSAEVRQVARISQEKGR